MNSIDHDETMQRVYELPWYCMIVLCPCSVSHSHASGDDVTPGNDRTGDVDTGCSDDAGPDTGVDEYRVIRFKVLRGCEAGSIA